MISIIICAFNQSFLTKSILKDLSCLKIPHETIVVNNGSTDDTTHVIEQAGATHIKLTTNMGFGRANNIGYAASTGDHVLFLNNDVIVKGRKTDWPEKLIGNGIVCCQSGLLSNSFDFIQEGKGNLNQPHGYCSGWCLMAARNIWESLKLPYSYVDGAIIERTSPGPWNEKFFLYFEDGDLTFRAKKQGIILEERDAPIQHIARATSRAAGLIGWYKESKKLMIQEWKNK
jgi:GT2 family glycosyltransferase